MSVVGFDVGNENCVIAVAKQRGIDVLLNDESNRENPAMVSFGEKQRFMGAAAAASATMHPKSTISQLKRLIGRRFREPDVQKDLRLFPFETCEDSDGGILIRLRYMGEMQSFSPVQLLGMLLSHLKQIAEKSLKAPVSDCVIGIPSYFTNSQRLAYLDAAAIAGLRPLRLMHDSTATALGYGIYKTDLAANSSPTCIVFIDIGHCDTQVCVASFESGSMRVLSHSFDRNLGGRDFDEVLFNYFAVEFKEKYSIDVYTNTKACVRLRASCEKVKKVLSANAEAPLNIECLMEEKDVKSFIKREEFEQLSSSLLERLIVPCQKALADSGLSLDQIHSVELVGSGSRIPAISKMLSSLFKRELGRTVNASECVARGCALQCAMLSPVFRVRDYEVQDCFPFSIGFSSQNLEGRRIMQICQTTLTFSFTNPANPNFCKPKSLSPGFQWPPPRRLALPPCRGFSSDEFPVDETFLEKFGPKDKDTEDEARRRNWIERGWAPWEEILTPEADFARKSLNEGEEVPLQSPEAIEAFKMLRPSYRKKKIKEMGLTEDEWYAKQFEMRGDKPPPLDTAWAGPVVLRQIPPRDWPPRGWEVDRKELEFIREAHKLMAERVWLEDLDKDLKVGEDAAVDKMCLERFKVFLKQYNEWVEANKDRLEEESYKLDQDFYPGRRIRGKDYKEGMYELPFYYPGMICEGTVTTLHLYQGAFVDIGGVHEGWVPIKDNDWFWIRHFIKVGMHVIVEITAKRDPYRFRFPLELRFVHPNIDHMIFNKFDFPPIFHRDGDTNPDEIRRDCGRPPEPRKDPGSKPEEEGLLSDHPYVDKLWQLHVAEQMILDDYEANPEKYKGKKLSELSDDEDFDERKDIEYGEAYYKKSKLPKVTLKTSVKELDLEAALTERKYHNKLMMEAKARGEGYKIDKLRRNIEMDEYDSLHWRRSLEEREALLRDISSRQALGLPLEEPGRYKPGSFFGKDQYDPTSALYQYDYWGEPKNSEISKQERMKDAHNKSIVGKGNVWYDMSYDDAIKQTIERRKDGSNLVSQEEETESEEEDEDDDDDDEFEFDDFDYSILSDESSIGYSEQQPLVNGTQVLTD